MPPFPPSAIESLIENLVEKAKSIYSHGPYQAREKNYVLYNPLTHTQYFIFTLEPEKVYGARVYSTNSLENLRIQKNHIIAAMTIENARTLWTELCVNGYAEVMY
jgi:hypothetical protein